MKGATTRRTLLALHLALAGALAVPACGGGGATSDDGGTPTGGDASPGHDASTGQEAGPDGALPAPESGAEGGPVEGGADTGPHDGGGHEAGPVDSGASDSSHTDGGDGGHAGDGGDGGPFVTASHPRMPLVVDQGGAVIATPHLTSVTFASTYLDAVSDLDAFVSTIGSQPYWAAATSEYGVAAPVVETPVHLAESAPATLTDAQIQAWLVAKIQGGAAGFTGATTSSLFVLYYPSTTTISQTTTSKSCAQFDGYHGSVQVTVGGQSTLVAYAVIPECPPTPTDAGTQYTTLQLTTSAVSHELVEACTDPYVDRYKTTTLGWVGTAPFNATTDPYAAWPLGIIGSYDSIELGDMCEGFGSSWFTPSGFKYMVQRTWSNAAVKASKDPCAPYHTGEAAYFLAQPVFDPDFAAHEAANPPQYLPSVPLKMQGGGTIDTQGLKIPVGSSATIPLILWSDAPVAQPWTVSAFDPSIDFGNASPYVSFTFDKTSGNNGDTIQLTIHVNAANTAVGGEVFGVTSTDGVLRHSTYGFVAN